MLQHVFPISLLNKEDGSPVPYEEEGDPMWKMMNLDRFWEYLDEEGKRSYRTLGFTRPMGDATEGSTEPEDVEGSNWFADADLEGDE